MVRHNFPRLLSSYSSVLESGESILTVSICCKEFRFTKFTRFINKKHNESYESMFVLFKAATLYTKCK